VLPVKNDPIPQIKPKHPEVEKLIAGDQRFIQELYQNLLPKIKSYLQMHQCSHDDANDIFQRALYQLIVRARVKGLDIKSSFDNYVFTTCKYLWFKELKKRRKEVRNPDLIELKDEASHMADSISEQERWELFELGLMSLSEKCRNLLTAYFKKEAYESIVERFGYASENVAFQSVFKCKQRLMNWIKAHPHFNLVKKWMKLFINA
jgi:RNA polymerase sigma factor (sigma-70 family)